MSENKQQTIDTANATFWDTLCGSGLAETLGIVDDSPASLKKFDDWYMDYYPYLTTHVPLHEFAGKKVVEIGLGYGTLSQKIAEAHADYLGLDIAAGPVGMVAHRLKQANLPGLTLQRSFLANNLPSGSVDRVVAIGCFHHTGNVQGCFDEAHRILRSGGKAHMMIYNKYSHRRLQQDRNGFLAELLEEEFGHIQIETASEFDRAASDTDLMGNAAPETVYLSQKHTTSMLTKFAHVTITKENMDESADPAFDRKSVLATWGNRAGLDLYITATK